MNSSILIAVGNHLWQSTLFALALGCITLLLRRNSARIRCCLWLAASVKFLVPFAWLTALGAHIPWPFDSIHLATPALMGLTGQTAAQGARLGAEHATTLAQGVHAVNDNGIVLIALELVWAIGTLAAAARWFSRWLQVRLMLQESTLIALSFVTPVRTSSLQFEPAVVGVLHPVLLLPEAMEQHLAAAELAAVLAHEHCHVAWRDNLAASIHMFVEALFWFHPLVWWLGGRMVDEREHACDEQVLAQGHTSRTYAEGILKVCEHYLQSPLANAAGVGGGNLSQRIEAIMKNRLIKGLGTARKTVLLVAACATVVIPIGIGILTSPHGRAEAATADLNMPVLRNVSIRLAPPAVPGQWPEGLFNPLGQVLENGKRVQILTSLTRAIAMAYRDVSRIVGRDLTKEPMYQITVDNPWPEGPTASGGERAALHNKAIEELSPLLRNLLTSQFGLVARKERRQMAGYALTIGPGGSKLKPDGRAPEWKKTWASSSEGISATDVPINPLVGFLEGMLQAPVVDKTALTATYDYDWHIPTSAGRPDPAAIAKTLEERFGLHLEAKTVTVNVLNVTDVKSPEQVLSSN